MTPLLLLVLFAIYGLVIAGFIVILRWCGVSSTWRILASFLMFGAVAGMLTAWQWPSDCIFLYDLPAAYLGNEGYVWSINKFGDSYASNAHETIPWVLRVPEVFVVISILFWGLIGVLVQLIANNGKRMRRLKHRNELAVGAILCPVVLAVWLVVRGWAEPPSWGNPTSAADGSSALVTSSELIAPATTAPGHAPTPAPFQSNHRPGVADLLRTRPAPMQSIEVDAYFSGAGAMPFSKPPPPRDQVICPLFPASRALTDRPLLAVLMYLNATTGNSLLADAPWLLAVTPEDARPGARSLPPLPYHARLRGHFGEPALGHCEHADRIFMVEQVVRVYEQNLPDPSIYQLKPPADYARWPRYRDSLYGYSLPYPPDWRVEKLDDVTLLVKGPQWPDNPVFVSVHQGETHDDQYNPSARPPLLQGQSWSVFDQGNWPYAGGANIPQGQHLAGYVVDSGQTAGSRSVSTLLSGNGYTYELRLTYPTGFAASQTLLTDYTAIVEGFALDRNPGPSPTPPINRTLGSGPLLSQDQVVTLATKRAGGKLELLAAQLLSEQAARRAEGPTPCGSFMGHPDGVWMLLVRGSFNGATRTMRLFLDAQNGDQLCGEEVSPDATPWPTLRPGVTATPARK